LARHGGCFCITTNIILAVERVVHSWETRTRGHGRLSA
jgi:hypothetical protein